MLKYLILAVLFYLIYLVFFRKKQKKQSQNESQTLVECSCCEVFISMDEAIKRDGKYFCSKECLKA